MFTTDPTINRTRTAISANSRTTTRTVRRVAVTCAGLAGGLLAIPVAAEGGSAPSRSQAGNPTCRGVAATHVDEDGGPGNDVIVVTMSGLEVNAWAGDDLVCVSTGGRYGATVRGSSGSDSIITYSGFNSIYGGADGDSIMSNSADHLLDGEEGRDNIYIGSLPDAIVYGGSEADRIFGSPGSDAVNSGDGDDLVITFGGDDSIVAGNGNDRLEGGAGSDTLDGSNNSDTCVDTVAPHTTFLSCETVIGLAFESDSDLAWG